MQDFNLCKAVVIGINPKAAWLKRKLIKHRFAVRAMKTTAFLMLVCFLQVSAKVPAQEKITIKEKGASLIKIFTQINKQTGYNFLFTSEDIKLAKPVDIDVKNASLKEVLEICFKKQELIYNVSNKIITVQAKKNDPQPVKASSTSIDVLNIHGKVVDENGKPVPGVTVTVKGTKKQTITDENGEFTIPGVETNAILAFSSVNMEPFEIRVEGKTEIYAKLKMKTSELDEVQIIAYGQTTKRLQTGNVTTVTSEDIEKQPINNPLLALQGRVPGLEVTQLTGLPGGNVTTRIQGRNSIMSGQDPLVVIDGVPYPTQLTNGDYDLTIVQNGSPLNYINPSDIESIDVLKDADATAIYGSRAANGAILITTKKGKAGKTQLTINMQEGWGKVGHFVDMMNTKQYLQMRWEALRNANQIPSANRSSSSPFVYAPDLLFWDTTRYTNWQRTLIGRTAQYTDINATLSGGSTTIQYLVGGSFKRQTTVFPGSFDDKVGTCHFNINATAPDQRLRLQLNGSYSYDQNHLPNIDLTNTALLMEPDAPALYHSDGTLNWAQTASGRSTWTNPLAYTASTDFFNNTKNLVSNALLSYKILPYLTLNSSFGYTNLQTSVFSPFRLELYKPESRVFFERYAGFSNRNMSSWIVEPQIQYSHKLSKGNLDALLGTTIQKSTYDFLQIYGYGFSNDLLMKTLSAATSFSVGLNKSGITRFNALFGRIKYNWKDKYLINITGRRDGSNKFGDANKFHDFWSVGGAWIFSNENWLHNNLTIISFGKLRSSYGTTGNDQIPDFSYLSVYDISNPTILYQGNIGLVAERISNPHLQWEETRKWQIGLDLGFIGDRGIIGITYARNRSSNQLIQYTLPNVTGFESFLENLPAIIQNTNWEFSIKTKNIKGRNFSWTSSVNLTVPRNKLISFPGIENTSYASGGTGVKIGEPVGVIQVSHYGGINPVNGAYFMLDGNNNANLQTSGLNVYVSTQSIYYGGVMNTLNFKGFQLDFLFQFVRKRGPRDMFFYNGTKYPGEFLAGSSNQPITVMNHWQKPGDIKNASLYLSSGGIYSLTPLRTSDAWYSFDASYIRLKNLSLSWQIPGSILKKAHIQNARIYLHGQNLITITHYSGLDPETMSINTLPPLKMWTFGGQIGF